MTTPIAHEPRRPASGGVEPLIFRRRARLTKLATASATTAALLGSLLLPTTGVANAQSARFDEGAAVSKVRLDSLSTASSNTYLEPDGTRTLEAFADPVNYRSPAGDWKAIDNSFVDAPGSVYAVQNSANDYTAKIPADASSTPVRFIVGDSWVAMRMHGADAAPVIDDSEATFSHVREAEEVSYVATSEGLKENIVLQSPPNIGSDVLSYTYSLSASPDLHPMLAANGSVEFQNSAGEVLVAIPAGVMTDAASATSYEVNYALVQDGDRWSLVLTPDAAWLTDPDRVYPVTIDPTLTNHPDSKDCWINQDAPNSNYCGVNQTYIRTGRLDSNSRRRGLLDFNVSTVPSDATVTSATVSLDLDSSQTANGNGGGDYAFFATGKSFDNAATWNSAGANGSWTGGSPQGLPYGTKHLTGNTSGFKDFTGLAGLFQSWVEGTLPHRGLVLKQIDETVNNAVAFYSRADSNGAKSPYLNLNYTVPATLDDEASDDETGGNEILSVTVPQSADSPSEESDTATLPGCVPSDANDCDVILDVQTGPDMAETGDDMVDAIGDGMAMRALPEGTMIDARARYYCVPTGCYSRVIAKTWTQHLCFVLCSANQATHTGKFYRTPDGSYVWETKAHGGVVGFHSCRVDHTIGVSIEPGKDKSCTAPRYGNRSIHSHYWVTVRALWVASELFLGSVWHNGDGSSSYHVKAF